MPELNPNPYESPAAVEQNASRAPLLRWRLIPTAIFGLLGAGGFAIGVFGAALMAYMFVARNLPPHIGIVAGSSFYGSIGIAWLTASRFYWLGRFRAAIIATLAGIAIPATIAFAMWYIGIM